MSNSDSYKCTYASAVKRSNCVTVTCSVSATNADANAISYSPPDTKSVSFAIFTP